MTKEEEMNAAEEARALSLGSGLSHQVQLDNARKSKRWNDAMQWFSDAIHTDSQDTHRADDAEIVERLRGLGFPADRTATAYPSSGLANRSSDFNDLKGRMGAANRTNTLENAGYPHWLAQAQSNVEAAGYQAGSWALNNLTGEPEHYTEALADLQANLRGIQDDPEGVQSVDDIFKQYADRTTPEAIERAKLNERLQNIQDKYPIFKNREGTPVRVEYKNPKFPARGGAAETYPPNERDAEGNLINDSGQWVIGIDNLDDPRIKGNLDNLILGELLHTVKGQDYYAGREWDRMAKNVMGMRDPEQLKLDDAAYEKTIAEHYDGDPSRYSKDQWENAHRRDAYVRSVLAPDNNAERWTNAEQEGYIKNHMEPFLYDPSIRMLGAIKGNSFSEKAQSAFHPMNRMADDPKFLSEAAKERTLTGDQQDLMRKYFAKQTQAVEDERGLARKFLAF